MGISRSRSLDFDCECASLFCSPLYFVILTGLLTIPALILGMVMKNRVQSAELQKKNIKRKRKQEKIQSCKPVTQKKDTKQFDKSNKFQQNAIKVVNLNVKTKRSPKLS